MNDRDIIRKEIKEAEERKASIQRIIAEANDKTIKTPVGILNTIHILIMNSRKSEDTLQQIIKLLKDEGVISQSPSMFDAQ